MRRICTIAIGLAFGTLITATSVRAATIDDFTVGSIELATTLSGGRVTQLQTGLDLGHVVGGVRRWDFDVREAFRTDPPEDAGARMAVSQDPLPGFRYEADDLVTAYLFTLQYPSAPAGARVNLAPERHNAIVLDVTFADLDAALSTPRLDFIIDLRTMGTLHTFVNFPSSATPYRVFVLLANTKGISPDELGPLTLGSFDGNLFGRLEISRIGTGSTADADFDGDVDGADLLVWQQNVGRTLPSGAFSHDRVAAGDADLNGVVNGRDLILWQKAQPPSPLSTAIPEPGAAVLLAVAIAGQRRRARIVANRG